MKYRSFLKDKIGSTNVVRLVPFVYQMARLFSWHTYSELGRSVTVRNRFRNLDGISVMRNVRASYFFAPVTPPYRTVSLFKWTLWPANNGPIKRIDASLFYSLRLVSSLPPSTTTTPSTCSLYSTSGFNQFIKRVSRRFQSGVVGNFELQMFLLELYTFSKAYNGLVDSLIN